MAGRRSRHNMEIRDTTSFSSSGSPSQSSSVGDENPSNQATSSQQLTVAAGQSSANVVVLGAGALPVTSEFAVRSQSGARKFEPTADCGPFCHRLCVWPSRPNDDTEVLHDMYHYVKDEAQDQVIAEAFMKASQIPPINLETLSELSTLRIMNNAKLRHDINFDRDLHLRPSCNRVLRQVKAQLTDGFWNGLQGELWLSALVQSEIKNPIRPKAREYWLSISTMSLKRLPNVFYAVRDILKTLVPEEEQDTVLERIDVELIVQEVQNGVCDFVGLAHWLCEVLKKYCAPMRDAAITSMRDTIIDGVERDTSVQIGLGLRQLLDILETMKLDVANNQIQNMRITLVEDTVSFQHRYHAHRIATAGISIVSAQVWLQAEARRMAAAQQDVASPLNIFVSAFMQSILAEGSAAIFPYPFYLDLDRLRILHAEFRDVVHHRICARVFIRLTHRRFPPTRIAAEVKALRSVITDLVGYPGNFVENRDSIAIEVMRSVIRIEGRDTRVDHDLLALIEDQLTNDLKRISAAYGVEIRTWASELLPKLQTSVKNHIGLSPIALQDAFVPLPTPGVPRSLATVAPTSATAQAQSPRQSSSMINRMTHLICLHWQIWAPLAYLAPSPGETVQHSGVNWSIRTPYDTVQTGDTVFNAGPGRGGSGTLNFGSLASVPEASSESDGAESSNDADDSQSAGSEEPSRPIRRNPFEGE